MPVIFLYGTLFIMAGAYALSRNAHVRGDFLYRAWQPKTQARMDLLLYFLFFFPGIIAFIYSGYGFAAQSWVSHEHSAYSPDGPPIYHYKTLIPVTGVLLLLQGVVEVIRCLVCLRTGAWPQRLHDVEELEKVILEQHADASQAMTDPQLGVFMLILFVGLIMLGFPIAFTLMAMGVGFAWLAFDGNWEPVMSLLVQRTWSVMTNDILISVPLFVFMGYVVERANILDRLFRSIQLASGGLPGSLAIATLATCALFATATGIVGAVVTLMGLLAFPAMLRHGYDVKLSAGVVCAGGCLGILIPPSIMLILYGATAGVSPVQLYAGALFPGLMLAGMYMVYVMIRAILNPALAPPLPPEERNVPIFTIIYELLTAFVPLALLIFSVLGRHHVRARHALGSRRHWGAWRIGARRRLSLAHLREAQGVGLSHGAHLGHDRLAVCGLFHLLRGVRHPGRRCGDQGFRRGA